MVQSVKTIFRSGVTYWTVDSDPGSMIFSHILEQSPSNWETTKRQNVVLTIFYTQNICHHVSELHCNVLLVSNIGEKVMKSRTTMGQICPIVFLAFQTLEKNKTSKFGSESFPRMVTYFLCVKNCQNYILTHSCLPIPRRLF